MTAQASNTGPLICRLILMPNDPLGQINSNNPHPCLSSLLARRTEASRSRARAPQHRRSRPRGSRGSSAMGAEAARPRRLANGARALLPMLPCHVSEHQRWLLATPSTCHRPWLGTRTAATAAGMQRPRPTRARPGPRLGAGAQTAPRRQG